MNYEEGPSQLRSKTDGSLVDTLAGKIQDFTLGGVYFVVDYTDSPSELRLSADGTLIQTLKGKIYSETNPGGINTSPNETYFIVDYADAPSELRLSADGTLIKTLTGNVSSETDQFGLTLSVTFSPNETYFIVNYTDAPSELRLSANGSLIETFEEKTFSAGNIIFSPNETYFVVPYPDGTAELRRTDDGSLIQPFPYDLQGYGNNITFSPQGTYFVVSNYDEKPDELRRTHDGLPIATLPDAVESVIFNPTESLFVITIYYQTELRHLDNVSLIESLTGITFSPDQTYFVANYADKPSELRRARNGSVVATLNGNVRIYGSTPQIKFTPNSTILYSIIDNGDYQYSRELRRTSDGSLIVTESICGAAFYPDKPYFLVDYACNYGDNNKPGELRSIVDGSVIETLAGDVDTSISDYLSGESYTNEDHTFDFSPDNNYFVIRYTDAPSELRNAADGSLIKKFPGIIDQLQFDNINSNDLPNDSTASLLQLVYQDDREDMWYLGDEVFQVVKPDRELDLNEGTPTEIEFRNPLIVNQQRLIIRYEGGVSYLVDLAWLQKLGGVINPNLSPEEFAEVACQPFKEGLFNDSALDKYLPEAERLACR
ncbi:MAG: WD40 repeat domain-containing protein [Anaerolineales bacterium]|nr:WD40 repeat domain-containing protein [Anaerolineales bacterium]